MDWSLLHPFWAIGLPIAGSLPLGWWMARVLDPKPERVGKGIDSLPMILLRALGHRQPSQMGWRRYATSLLAFNAALFVLSFLILLAQGILPLNPDAKGSLTTLGYKDAAGVDHPGADTAVIFNTVCSFVTNTNLQHYSGEQHLSYFSQLGGIVWLQFVTPACGLAVMLAVIRGLRGDRHLGDFYLDTIRSLVLVLVPMSVLVAVLLVATGVPMTFRGAAKASTIEKGSRRSPWDRSPQRSRSSSSAPTGADSSGPTRRIRSRTRPLGATSSKSSRSSSSRCPRSSCSGG